MLFFAPFWRILLNLASTDINYLKLSNFFGFFVKHAISPLYFLLNSNSLLVLILALFSAKNSSFEPTFRFSKIH